MGIQGLIPFLEKASEQINIKSLKGSTVAIDSYCWLHKGAFGVGDKLARGEKTDVHIIYCLKYVNLLLSHNIKPILVFDGRHLPAKAETEAKRRESRKAAKQRAVELMRQGNHREAANHLRRCVDITHEMALELIKVCRAINVDCIVAPYEADAQLAYLNKIGMADYVITEDSDLTLFGCKKILFKLDLTGSCLLVNSGKLHLAMDCNENKFTMDKFRLMCILSGCDYVDSLPGIGLAKACKFVMKTEETDLMRALDKIPPYLNMRHLVVSDEYKINVLKAQATFLHMVVFDPRMRKQVRLHEIDEIGTDIEYCSNAGEILDGEMALHLAVGNLNPFSMKKLDDWHPDHRERAKMPPISVKGLKIANHPSIWKMNYQFNTLLNGTSISKTILSAPKVLDKKSPKPPKRIIDVMEEDVDLPSESQNDDMVLEQYMNANEPSLKRFKENDDDDTSANVEINDVTKVTPNRNPFKKSIKCKDELHSPTRISHENNSLIKNQSPVKRVEFPKSPAKRIEEQKSPTKRISLDKLTKLSRFHRTSECVNKQIISRYFGTASKDKLGATIKPIPTTSVVKSIEEPVTPVVEPVVTKISSGVQMKSPNILSEITDETKSHLYFKKSNDSGISQNGDEPKGNYVENDTEDDDLNVASQRSILDQFKFMAKKEFITERDSEPMKCSQGTSDSNKTDSESNQLPIEICDNESESSEKEKESTKRMWLTGLKTSTKTAPKATLRRKKSTTSNKAANSSSGIQNRLSMYFFQAKPEMKQ